jgi:hypothetical protein
MCRVLFLKNTMNSETAMHKVKTSRGKTGIQEPNTQNIDNMGINN